MTKDFAFLDWDGRPGAPGQFRFSAEPGTLLAYGQKDIRKGRGGVDGYQVCLPDGTLACLRDSIVLAVLHLPIADRLAAIAEHLIETEHAAITEHRKSLAGTTDTSSTSYYQAKIAEAEESISYWERFLPVAVDAESYLSGEA